MNLLKHDKLKGVIIHCSASNYGNYDVIKKWHTDPPRNWSDIGYHYLIENGFPTGKDWTEKKYHADRDGAIVNGRNITFAGAHCEGHNSEYIGICIIGDYLFTLKQFYALNDLLNKIIRVNLIPYFKRPFTAESLVGHCQLDTHGKTCPNIEMDLLRGWINSQI